MNTGFLFGLIGAPIIVFVLLVSCCVYCYSPTREAKSTDALRRIEAATGEPELVVIEPGTVRDVDTGFKGGKKEGGLELPLHTKESHEVTEAPPS